MPTQRGEASGKSIIIIGAGLAGLSAGCYPLVDNFRTFEWPRASDLQELVVGSRA